VFKPYAGVSTAALILQKGKPTTSVWFYNLTADGFSLDDKRTAINDNDIPDLLAKFTTREEGPNSYCVPIAKIRENNWSLASGPYKSVIVTAVKHDSPSDILAEIAATERKILEGVAKLSAKLGHGNLTRKH
jgi:type I restriction enzyme M protein